MKFRGCERNELVIICDLPLCWETEAEDEPWERGRHAERERADLFASPLWERQHVLEGLWATGFIPPQACLSQYGGGWLLNGSTWPYASPLSRSDFTGLPSQHPPAVLYTAAPPEPPPLAPSLPPSTHSLPPAQLPPAGSSLNDTLSICLIISPSATPPRSSLSSLGSSFCSQGGGEGATGSSTGLPDCSPRGPHSLWHHQPHSKSSSKLWAYGRAPERLS